MTPPAKKPANSVTGKTMPPSVVKPPAGGGQNGSVTRSYLGGKDFALSQRLAYCSPIDLPHHFVFLRGICKVLEWSGHGVPWFILTIAQTSIAIPWSDVEFWTNMIWALIIDLVVVAITKTVVRRARPNYAVQLNQFLPYSPDVYSFPSGHSSRTVMMATLFCTQWVTHYYSQMAFIAWAVAVCISRAVLGRHFVGDIVAGAMLGTALAYLHVTYLWLDIKTCLWLLWPLHEYLFI